MPVGIPQRLLGKLPARADPRIPMLSNRVDLAKFPPLPRQVAWHAKLPFSGVPILANDKFGCCVEASVCHFLQQIGLYTNHVVDPTEAECLKIYADVTGFNAADPATDQGTYFAGHGSMLERWASAGVTVGGKLNRCGPVAKVDFTDPVMLQNAINVFGYVFVGANMTQMDVDSSFMWNQKIGPVIGGHEILLTGFEKTLNAVRYDVLTWNGMWRASDIWIKASVDEAYVVFDQAFMDAHGMSPSGIDRKALLADLAALGGHRSH